MKTDLNRYLTAMIDRKTSYCIQIRCRDGFHFSVGASTYHRCLPQNHKGPWSHVEVWGCSDLVYRLLDYSIPACTPGNLTFGKVPIEVMEEIIDLHGGVDGSSPGWPAAETTVPLGAYPTGGPMRLVDDLSGKRDKRKRHPIQWWAIGYWSFIGIFTAFILALVLAAAASLIHYTFTNVF
jgi:hypothetical protein